MGVYDAQVALAERLIREKGKAVSIVRLTEVVADPTKPWVTGDATETLDDAFGVFLNFNAKDMETNFKMEGTDIQAGDRKVLLAAASVTAAPSTSDKLRDENGDWSIESVQSLAPNGEQILYTLRVRR